MEKLRTRLSLLGMLSLGLATVSNAQHEMPHPTMHDSMMQMHDIPLPVSMSSSLSLSLPMNRNGAGTGWQPDSTPVFGTMIHLGPWTVMAHGDFYLRYNAQNFNNDGKRGDNHQVDGPKWTMLMLQRPTGRNGLVAITGMFSLERLTLRGDGYPLLFQTGESWKGRPLEDRQHPHDLITALSVSYSHRLSPYADVFAYVGYPGEPALGPVAFMHRGSAWGSPDATLGHHWQDATHIVFGVATLGFRLGMFKLEASSFTGREPDDNRYRFDKPRFDSHSYRLSMNPGPRWSLQFSQGLLHSLKALQPAEDVLRTTASASQSQPLGHGNYLLSSVLFGMNKTDGHREPSFGLESALLLGRWSFNARYEYIQKSAAELVLEGDPQRNYDIHALKPGVSFCFASIYGLRLRLGGEATFHFIEEALQPLYGKRPVSGVVFLRVSPKHLKMNGV